MGKTETKEIWKICRCIIGKCQSTNNDESIFSESNHGGLWIRKEIGKKQVQGEVCPLVSLGKVTLS